jgi:hypothetical protein
LGSGAVGLCPPRCLLHHPVLSSLYDSEYEMSNYERWPDALSTGSSAR